MAMGMGDRVGVATGRPGADLFAGAGICAGADLFAGAGIFAGADLFAVAAFFAGAGLFADLFGADIVAGAADGHGAGPGRSHLSNTP